jgi:uncharacterized protein (DUF488 family)
MTNLFTIGFTQKSAEKFFDLLMKNKVKRIVDIRINNSSQLAGFAKSEDLKYFAEKIAGIGYIYMPELAPTLEMMRNYRAKGSSWEKYQREYLKLINKRKISEKINIKEFDRSCFLCSEHTPENCHRRLLTEYLQKHNKNVKIIHLF